MGIEDEYRKRQEETNQVLGKLDILEQVDLNQIPGDEHFDAKDAIKFPFGIYTGQVLPRFCVLPCKQALMCFSPFKTSLNSANGFGCMKYDNGFAYVGEWILNCRDGKGWSYRKQRDGSISDVYYGEWRKNSMDGLGVLVSNGSTYRGYFQQNQVSVEVPRFALLRSVIVSVEGSDAWDRISREHSWVLSWRMGARQEVWSW